MLDTRYWRAGVRLLIEHPASSIEHPSQHAGERIVE